MLTRKAKNCDVIIIVVVMVLLHCYLLTNKISGAIIVTGGLSGGQQNIENVVNCGILRHQKEEEDVYLGMDFPRA